MITLAFIVLVTVAILAFFSQTRATLIISRSVPARTAQELLAQSAIEATISDLRLEMLAGAETDAQRTDFGYLDPMTVRRRWAMVPARVVSTNVPASGFATLVKQSLHGQPFYPGSNPASAYAAQGPAGATGSLRASAVNTGTESPNGRMLSTNRWDSVGLTTSTLPATALPDWIYVTRGGVPENAQSLDGAAVSDPSIGSTNYVTGRYAYNIYDVGGLLNINAAGAPQSLADASRKGSLAWADLTAVGLTSDQIAQIIHFRNLHSQGLSNYGDLIRGQAELLGFLAPLQTSGGYDGYFYTRGDMIRFFLNLFGADSVRDCTPDERGIIASFAQDLRFLAAPSWAPDPNRLTIASGAGGNDSYGEDGAINPNLNTTNFVVTADNEFTRLRDDTNGNPAREVPAKKGEPFLNSRFPLSRLALITNGASATAGSPIERYFGLTNAATGTGWVYEHGSTDGSGSQHILTLDQVRALTPPREPDMVELLKAAIVAGSLGKSAGTAPTSSTAGGSTAGGPCAYYRDQSLDGQVIQIFANLIDQFDADGYPTEILFTIPNPPANTYNVLFPTAFYGVENLPYLTRIKTFLVRMEPDSVADAETDLYELAFLPEVWNPHDSVDLPSNGPTSIRVVADSRVPGLEQIGPKVFNVRVLQNNNSANTWTTTVNAGFTPDANNAIVDSTTLASKEPALLKSGFATNTTDTPNPGGIHTLPFNLPSTWPATGAIGFQIYTDQAYPGIVFGMEYLGPDNQWHRYFDRRITRSADATSGGSAAARGRSSPTYYVQQNNCRTVAPDPRSDRFSSYRIQELESAAGAYVDGASLRPNQGAGYGFVYSSGRPLSPDPGDHSSGWTLGTASQDSSAQAIGTILQNTNSSGTYYADPDGVVRPGDGALASGNGVEGQMYLPGNLSSRPIVLNRPFRSVGEMGYAFRGTPCRSLDFFSAASGDAALLDFFSVSEVPDDGVTGGRISINSANVNTLAALLRGALTDEESGSTLTVARATEAAQSLVNLISDTSASGGPLLNRTELVTRWLGDQGRLDIGSDSERIKRQREVFVRALADTAETRTWNLLIDLIAQTGRLPKGDPGLDQFLVESERHVWVHLSIDRLTGRIVHLSQEPADD